MSWTPKDFEEEIRLPVLDGLPNNGHSQASGFYFPAAFSLFFPKPIVCLFIVYCCSTINTADSTLYAEWSKCLPAVPKPWKALSWKTKKSSSNMVIVTSLLTLKKNKPTNSDLVLHLYNNLLINIPMQSSSLIKKISSTGVESCQT